MPKYIYKYVSAKTLLTILKDQTLKFSSPEQFNDPFEGHLFQPPIYTLGTATKFVEEKFSKLKEYFLNGTDKDNDLPLMYNIRCFMMQLAKTGAFCCTENHENILMWSHYADCHKGACLKFNTEILQKQFSDIRRVIYASGMDHLNIFENANYAIKNAMTYKALDWHYEKEIRVFNQPGIIKYDVAALEAIYLGVNFIKNIDMKIFFDAYQSDERYAKVNIMRGQIDDSAFVIHFNAHIKIGGFNENTFKKT
ncbi:DUF2971 domain-containing protein [Mucilaginibacter rigui]|uniref:DUF2971 domain-containing protein n=1 Tax=Mucilaginibacter rigui TaxID=534635 RepID=A0ABR7X624_9SPHI|nr:DUF2971 domain-containing protein [Mucilaginibacter rigui]MBD1386006.1 DUF2971 domain-containing protein [Mucilaginibacter rigui]